MSTWIVAIVSWDAGCYGYLRIAVDSQFVLVETAEPVGHIETFRFRLKIRDLDKILGHEISFLKICATRNDNIRTNDFCALDELPMLISEIVICDADFLHDRA